MAIGFRSTVAASAGQAKETHSAPQTQSYTSHISALLLYLILICFLFASQHNCRVLRRDALSFSCLETDVGNATEINSAKKM